MSEETELPLKDGRRVRIRMASVADAQRVIDLDRALAIAGDGMVLTPDQMRTLEEEQQRIDDVYRAMSAGDATLAIVAELDGRIVGSADLRQLGPARCHHVALLSVGVHPEFHRLGLGRAMMMHLIDHARACAILRLELYVRGDNDKAQKLYRSLGFSHEGTRVRFIRRDDGTFVDDFIYVRFLEGKAEAS